MRTACVGRVNANAATPYASMRQSQTTQFVIQKDALI